MSLSGYYPKEEYENRKRQFNNDEDHIKSKKIFLDHIKESTQLERMKRIRFGRDTYGEDLKKHRENLAYLGNVSEDKGLYFEKTKETAEAASLFLDSFFSVHAQTLADQHQYFKAQPGCISFTTIHLKKTNQDICLVTKSYGRINVEKEIIETINYLNRNSNMHFVWIPFTDTINDFLKMVNKQLNIKIQNINKSCSEKGLLSVMFDLFAQHGDDIFIKGMINCKFYPFPNNEAPSTFEQRTGIEEFKSFEKINHMKNEFFESSDFRLDNLSGAYRTHTMDACKCCKLYKDSSLVILSWAQLHNTRIAEVAPRGFSLPAQDGLLDFNKLKRKEKTLDSESRNSSTRRIKEEKMLSYPPSSQFDFQRLNEREVKLVDARELSFGKDVRSEDARDFSFGTRSFAEDDIRYNRCPQTSFYQPTPSQRYMNNPATFYHGKQNRQPLAENNNRPEPESSKYTKHPSQKRASKETLHPYSARTFSPHQKQWKNREDRRRARAAARTSDASR